MNTLKSIMLIISALILSVCVIIPSYAKSYENFTGDFRSALDENFTEEQLNLMFSNYSELLTPHGESSALYNELKGIKVSSFPLEEFKKEDLYKSNICKLLMSKNQNHRILAYLVIAASNEKKYNDVLLERIRNEKNKGNRIWAGLALLHLKDAHTSELFDFLVNDEGFGDAHMLPLYVRLERDRLRETAYVKIRSDNVKAKVLAVSILGVTGLSKKTEDALKKAATEWPMDIKGYAIYSLKNISAGNLLNTLKPFLDKRDMRQISLQALANSPTPEDRDYILSLIPAENKVPAEVLELLVNSANNTLLERWLQLVQTDRIPGDYSSSIELDSRLLLKEMRPQLLKAVPNVKNHKITADIANKLRGEKYYDTEDVLMSLLRHDNDSVRYWAASSLKGGKSSVLAAMLPEPLKSSAYRTVGLTDLILEYDISNLHSHMKTF